MSNIDPVESLFERAKANGVQMYVVCDRARVARSTPSRWRGDKNGATYATLKRLNAALDDLITERAHAAAPTAPANSASCGKSGEVAAQERAA